MPDSRNQHIANDHPAYSLNLIIDSSHPGLLDSSGQYIAPSLFSFEQNGAFIAGYPGVHLDKPQKNAKFLFTVRDLAGENKIMINSWKITLRDPDAKTPLNQKFPVTSEDVEKPVIDIKAEKQYCTYALLETSFLDPADIVYQPYRMTMQLNVTKAGEQGVLLFASDPEMIIEDEGGGAVDSATRGASA